MNMFKTVVLWLSTLSLVFAGSLPQPVVARHIAPAHAGAPDTGATPGVVVDFYADDWTLSSGGAAVWHTRPFCNTELGVINEEIRRKSGASKFKTYHAPNCTPNPRVLSNLVADDTHVYWSTDIGIVRQLLTYNGNSPPEIFNDDVSGPLVLAIDDDRVYVMKRVGSNGEMFSINKESRFASNWFDFVSPGPIMQFKAAQGARTFLYWIANGNLYRYERSADELKLIASDVSAHAGGVTDVFYARTIAGVSYIWRYGNVTETNLGQLTSMSEGIVTGMVAGGGNVFVLRQRTCAVDCGAPNVIGELLRIKINTPAPELLYGMPPGYTMLLKEIYLNPAADTVLWLEWNQILKLAANVSVSGPPNVRVTGIEMVQTIQRSGVDKVDMVADKRTGVVLRVRSDDGVKVNGVSAVLQRLNGANAVIGTLNPINNSLSVVPAPRADVMSESFFFELPPSWLAAGSSLRLRGRVNPAHYPVESTYDDNASSILITTPFVNSGRLAIRMVRWGYTYDKYWEITDEETEHIKSWMRRAYPLSSVKGNISNPAPGFRPDVYEVYDADLAAHVNWFWNSDCDDNLCAAYHSNDEMRDIRKDMGLGKKNYFAGLIPHRYEFPRGVAEASKYVTSIPVGEPWLLGMQGWDTDKTYGDWYSGHEIGHTLGRKHPNASSGKSGCGHSADDSGFPYDTARIGNDANDLGYDVGDPALGIAPKAMDGTKWFDVMSYCNNQWISDYTYEGIASKIGTGALLARDAHVGTAAVGHAAGGHAAGGDNFLGRSSGDWLTVDGHFMADHQSARITQLRHDASTSDLPEQEGGDYALQLLNAGGGLLASHPFSPEISHHGGTGSLAFSKVVTFESGTRSVRVVHVTDGRVLATRTLSANAPAFGSLPLATSDGVASPGRTVTLTWAASDPDGDPLKFNLSYSRDGGRTLRPLRRNITETRVVLDMLELGGGTVQLAVIAHDGAHTVEAMSEAVTLQTAPPRVQITSPGPGQTLTEGSSVHFEAEADDPVEGQIAEALIEWRIEAGTAFTGFLGAGSSVITDALPAGQYLAVVTATNGQGLSASDRVTFTIRPNLAPVSPVLLAGPEGLSYRFVSPAAPTQTRVLDIANAGAPGMAWVVESDLPGLQFSQGSGVDGAMLTVSLDPRSVGYGLQRGHSVTITVAGDDDVPTQTLRLPVSVMVGKQDYPGGSLSYPRAMLPAVSR